ncbi:putative secreted protein [Rhodococcus phage E3]|uniref:putative secreted protein n=1 Tax=Rhodococcus phage E3 TaxID=1007869 RepID=UPI0002C6A027|nr:putative secreted protein [Rhodococcus phage E3]AEQ20916.1 putative secreted protein [Rhodococcus phage E3]
MITSILLSILAASTSSLAGAPVPLSAPAVYDPVPTEVVRAPSADSILTIEELLRSQVPLDDARWDSALPLVRAVNW